ncbi:MAG: hypothetical protein A2284_03735 [Deltaproteobacteria bacterium RIFOXYA12_FULL_61_11]|nr:MAG: hypothetical protein A2284_03735 [Deltaproteobacteria bacterium RIFOXYA12_FULL_61_11]
MAIKQLTEEQVRTWSIVEKDRWWFENVFRGNMPQLTVRSALTGMTIGGVLSLTNLYIGAKTGWTLGVGITSVILSFAFFKLLSKTGLGKEMTLLENNAMQSIATAAGYMTAPMISSLAAYMLITGRIVPQWQTFLWLIGLALLGVLFAFPMKRRFINDEQHPFPEGKAAGVVMDALHTGGEADGLFKAKLLVGGGLTSAALALFKDHTIMEKLGLKFLAIPEFVDDFLYTSFGLKPAILGTQLKDLTIRVETDFVMLAAGGLMGIRTGVSLMVGAFLNYFVLAPIMIEQGVITGVGFKAITMWALWGGVALMTTSSLYAFFSKPKMILSAFSGLFGKKTADSDLLVDIELPMKLFLYGIPVVGFFVVWMASVFFGVHWLMGIIAIPLVFIFSLIAANSTALTSITPTGALGKLTQLTYSVLAPGNVTTNLMTAGITGEVASNASNLLMDIKPGYMLGGKPRHQAMGHVLGIIAGAACAVPIFYIIFLKDGIASIGSESLPMPAAMIWKAVAEVLTKGLSFLHPTAQWAILIGGVLGIVMELIKTWTKNRFPLSAVGIGLAFVLPFHTSLVMFLGSFIFWTLEKRYPDPTHKVNQAVVQNQETICAGVIAGGAITGIVLILLGILLGG